MSYTQETVEFTPAKRDALRAAHTRAVSKGRESFVFEGREYLTEYAKYVLEYLDSQFRGAARRRLDAGRK